MRILELSESLPKYPDAEIDKYEADYAEAFDVYQDGVDFYIEDQLELTPEKIKSWGDSWKRFPELIDDLMQYYRSRGGVTSETKSTWSDMELALMEGGHSIEDWVCGKCNSEPCVCEGIKNTGNLFLTLENFADGKVSGKSRPGRVKRAGASCNGSVTDLRKRAKNASGEKAKMYHWCANMKSGRNK